MLPIVYLLTIFVFFSQKYFEIVVSHQSILNDSFIDDQIPNHDLPLLHSLDIISPALGTISYFLEMYLNKIGRQNFDTHQALFW